MVTVHGGGGVFGGRSQDAFWAEWLAEEGYVVFSIDYRLGDYQLGQTGWQDATGDVKCAVGWVKDNAGRYGVDPDRIALMGRSAGGQRVVLAAYTEGDPRLPPSCGVRDTGVEAVAAFYSLTDQMRFDEMAMQSPWWRPNLMSSADPTGGTESEPVLPTLDSPISHVDPGDPPTFLVPAVGGPVGAAGAVRAAGEPAGGAGVPHRLLELPGARHGLTAPGAAGMRRSPATSLGEFLARHLAG